jgi:hypothetical protein
MKHGHIEKLIATDYTLFTLETSSPEKIINSFRYFGRSGRATYVWEDTLGLYRLEASHITLPNTETPLQVLNYIQNNHHFGIYLLKGFNKFMQDNELQLIMKQLSDKKADKSSGSIKKVIIFLDKTFKLPEKLLNQFLMAQEPAESL